MQPVVKREGVPALKRRLKDSARQVWLRHPHVPRLLEDAYPGHWERVKTCHTVFRVYESMERPGHYKVQPNSCWQVPYCIVCTQLAVGRRTRQALNLFWRCTPRGKQPCFTHIVQTAPIYADGTGWGLAASRNTKAFGAIVHRALEEFYGPGIGCHMSYQHMGERLFAKIAPHMDLTLNGWRLNDENPALTPKIDLSGSGRRRWDEFVREQARSLDLTAEIGNVHFGHPTQGAAAYYPTLRYQVRELVDLRKLEYERDKGLVWWRSYKDNSRQRFTLHEFKAGLAAYEWQLGLYGARDQDDGGGQELHRSYGHMSKRRIRATQKLMDGAIPPHGTKCPCSQCGDWERVFLDDSDLQVEPSYDFLADGGPGATV